VTVSARQLYPPLRLADRVLSLRRWGDPFEAYEALGAETKRGLLSLLPDDWSFESKRVLDFGCGAGRTLRHFLLEAESGEFWGAELDPASVDWLRANLSPPLHVLRSTVDPPLPLESGSFDLVWAISVFTHLADNSHPWLLELHRLLAPGGLLIATYMGRWTSEVFVDEPWDEDKIGMNVLRHNQDWDNGGPMVLMSDWWVRAHWGRAFEIVAVEPNVHGQTWALLRKRDVDLTVAELEKPEDDPREHAALRHNVRQLERSIERLTVELRREYEHSGSWRLTRPLRFIAKKVRAMRSR
jgi:SAM-dependent methyltransferase